jgi:hypothetical protein
MFRDQLSVHLQGLCVHLEKEDWPHTNNRLKLILLLLHYILHCPPLPEEFILSRLEFFESLFMDLPPCQNYFRITIMFKLVAANILPNLCQRMITARSPIRPIWGIFKGSLDTELNTTQTYFLDQALQNFAFSEPRADAWNLSTSCNCPNGRTWQTGGECENVFCLVVLIWPGSIFNWSHSLIWTRALCSLLALFEVLTYQTYLLTPWSRVLLEKLTGSQLVKTFPAFHGTRRFIAALTSARHLSLSCAS